MYIKKWRRKSLTKLHSTPLDVHNPGEEASNGIASRNTQDSCGTPSQEHVKFCGRSKPSLIVPCALSVRHRERHTSTEERLDEEASSGRVDVEVKTEKRKWGL